MGRVDGKVALISGGARGMGAAHARMLVDEGAKVVIGDILDEDGKALADEIGDAARYVHLDVTQAEDWDAAVATAVNEFGKLNVLVNNAGIVALGQIGQFDMAKWQKVIDVNLTGTFLVSQAALPHLLENGGNIVNVASTAGLIGQPYSAAYCASKGGVVMLTKAMAYEYIERGIRVNAVAPGGIQTNLMESFGFPENSSRKLFYKITSPMGFAQPEEVAGLMAFLASDEARYMTGTVVPIDGGMTS
jgi:3alpha(or 20beta)-hydroxysteroid dehydrogenase